MRQIPFNQIRIKLIYLFLIIYVKSFGQTSDVNKNSDLYKNAPHWAKLMFENSPNVNEIDKLYEKYFETNAYVKSYYTQSYKRWRRSVDPFLNNEGYIDNTKKAKLFEIVEGLKKTYYKQSNNSNNWTPLGPFKNSTSNANSHGGAHANIYSIGRCEASPNIMYCGTEPGEVYKSIDGGNNWFNVSMSLVTSYTPGAVTANAGISALAVHPTNSDIVYIGSANIVYKTINGGTSWEVVLTNNIILGGYLENPAELHINTNDPNIVMVAGKQGIYRTTNAGSTWSQVVTEECYDIKSKPGSPNVLYTIKKNTATNTHQFLISTDAGITWNSQNTGWYNSTDSARTVEGARIAVTPADNNRIYAFLIGNSKSGDNGFIGVYRSNDGGNSWSNTMGYDGAPYTETTHPNLISSSPVTSSFSFNQGFYNCAIMASSTNPDQVLVGGIGMWRSIDGGQSFQCVYNYGCGNFNPMHVDMQDFRAFGNDYWATTDGGIYKSNDLFGTQPEFKMNGINAVDFWGFGSGWNRDILIGGTFHNGVDAYAEGFPNGDFLDLGGGEPASGYVNPSGLSRVYSSNIGSKILPQNITGTVLDAPYEESLNESPWFARSSELEFHPSCFNYLYKGYQNKLFKSVDGGASFSAIYTAPQNTKVLGIEISRSNPNTMIIVVLPNSGNCFLVKTTDNWATHSTITTPTPSQDIALISLDPENDQIIWLAYPYGSDGFKIFKSINSGATWTNQTSSSLDAQNIQAMTTIGGTNGGVYLATNVTCYYKNNTMAGWIPDNTGLPLSIGAIGIRPFYRDGKIRLASLGKGIWETPFFESPQRPVAKIMVDKLTANSTCDNIFNFDDYSMLNHTNATWAWTFQNGNIGTSNIRNPQVSFNTIGDHIVTLTVTNANGISDTDTIIVTTNSLSASSIAQNFETQLLQDGWFQNSTGSLAWSLDDTVGGFGQSSKCMKVNNFIISQENLYADINIPVNFSNITTSNAILTFDVAYSYYGGQYADKLQVLASTNCGIDNTILYDKAGEILATAPSTQSQFVPTATQWRTETIDLSSYIGNPNVHIKFRNINQYGQALYIDNIKLGNSQLNIENFNINDIFIYPNPLAINDSLKVFGNDSGKIKFNLFSIDGKLITTIFTSLNTPIALDKYNLSNGTYLYKIISNDRIINGKLIITSKK